jgi:hypothetical protein
MRIFFLHISLLSVLLLSVCSAVIAQPNIVMTSTNANVNDEVVIDVNLSGITSQTYSSLTYWAYYDSTKLEFLGFDFTSSILPSNRIQSSQNFNESSSLGFLSGPIKKLSFGFFDANPISSQGNLTKLRFRVKTSNNSQISRYYFALGDNAMQSTGGLITILENAIPTASTILNPVNSTSFTNSSSPSNTRLFEWSKSIDVDNTILTYTLRASDDPTFASTLWSKSIVNDTTTTINVTTIDSLLNVLNVAEGASTSLNFRVDVTDGNIVTVGTPNTYTITRGSLNTAPVAGNIVIPTQNQVITFNGSPTTTLNVIWNSATDAEDASAMTYVYELSATTSFNTISLTRNAAADTMASILYSDVNALLTGSAPEVLYHRVIANDGALSDTSAISTFVAIRGQINTPPVGAEITSPANNTVVAIEGNPNTILRPTWSAGTDADNDDLSYTWELSTSSSFSTVALSINTSELFAEATYGAVHALLTETVSVWNHRVITSDGISSDTSARASVIFQRGTLNAAPSVSEIISPANGTALTIGGEPTTDLVVSWTTSTDPNGDDVSYIWQLSTTNTFAPNDVIVASQSQDTTSIAFSFSTLAAILDANGVAPGASITLFHRAVSTDGVSTVNGTPVSVTFTRGRLTSVDDENLPVATSLAQNYPNPFNPSTTINFTLAESGMVRLSVYDLSGRMITNLVNDRQNAGNFSVTFDAANLPSGIYMYRLEAGSFSQIKKMTLLK